MKKYYLIRHISGDFLCEYLQGNGGYTYTERGIFTLDKRVYLQGNGGYTYTERGIFTLDNRVYYWGRTANEASAHLSRRSAIRLIRDGIKFGEFDCTPIFEIVSVYAEIGIVKKQTT